MYVDLQEGQTENSLLEKYYITVDCILEGACYTLPHNHTHYETEYCGDGLGYFIKNFMHQG